MATIFGWVFNTVIVADPTLDQEDGVSSPLISLEGIVASGANYKGDVDVDSYGNGFINDADTDEAVWGSATWGNDNVGATVTIDGTPRIIDEMINFGSASSGTENTITYDGITYDTADYAEPTVHVLLFTDGTYMVVMDNGYLSDLAFDLGISELDPNLLSLNLGGNEDAVTTTRTFGLLEDNYSPTGIISPSQDYIVEGTSFADLINGGYTGDPDGDMVDGGDALDGSDDDYIIAGDGNDTVVAGAGDDSILGGDGEDVIYGGDGADTIDGGNGTDTIYGDDGNDSIDSGLSADLVYGGSGADTINAGVGNDSVLGGSGNDLINGGAGADTLSGGDDADTFTGVTVGDVIDGGEGGLDSDTLDLSTSVPAGGSLTVTSTGAESGTVEFFDAGGASLGTASFVNIEKIVGGPSVPDYIVEGTSGDDSIDASYTGDPEGDMVDSGDALDGSDDDYITAGAGNDTILAGAGDDSVLGEDGQDYIEGGDGNDTILGGLASDTLYGNAGDDSLLGNEGDDYLIGLEGNDTLLGGTGGDSILGGLGEDYIEGNAGDDLLAGSEGDDTILAGDGNDTLYGGTDDDSLLGESGDDLFMVVNDFGNDTIEGGETGETDGDTLNLNPVTDDLTIDLTSANAEDGSFTDGVSTTSFVEIENIVLGSGTDTLVLGPSSGADIVSGFSSPTDNGDGTFDGNDQLDVTAVTDAGGAPVDTDDVTVTDTNGDGTGDAILSFPNGQSITLVGVLASAVSSPDQLAALGIPAAPAASLNYIVEGTAGDDLIDGAYTDDPEGDLVDANDNATGTNDDSIVAGAGSDTIDAGAGNDTIDAGTGDDVIMDSAGDDSVSGGDGKDRFDYTTITGNDTVVGGEVDDTTPTDSGDKLDFHNNVDDLTVVLTGDEQGTATDGTDTITFSEIEHIMGGQGADSIDASASTVGQILDGGEGSDTITGGSGDDIIALGQTQDFSATDGDNDVLVLADGFGNDSIEGYEVPTDTGGGTYSGNDQLDVTGLTDAGGALVDVDDVTVTDTNGDGTGDAILSFPNGESITLWGVLAADVSSSEQLIAMGIPAVSAATPLNYIVEGTGGDDVIDASYTGDPEGDMVDSGDALDGSDDDFITAGAGNDTVLAGAGDDSVLGDIGNDYIEGGAGDDTIRGGMGSDTIYGGLGNDSVHGNEGDDSLVGLDGNDTLLGETGNDTVIGGAGDDHLEGNEGADLIIGGAGDDFLRGSYGEDTLYGGTGDDFVWGGYGDDLIIVENDFGNDTIEGEEAFETIGDTLDLSLVTDDLTIDLTSANPENGSFTDGVSTTTYVEIENIILGSGNDTLVLGAASGADVVSGFSVPTDNGDGTYSGVDVLDVTALTDASGATVNTDDVTITDTNGDGTGDAILTFPNGESLTLIGVLPSEVDDPDVLEAMGIAQPNYIVDGTSGDDLIDGTYLTDPEGDVIDGLDDAAGTNNDSVLAGDGDDTVQSYAGDDTIDGGAGADDIDAGSGDDVLLGGTGNDTLKGWFGDDSIEGGAGDDSLIGWTGDDTFLGGTGADSIEAGDGEDVIIMEDGFGNDTIDGGDGGAIDSDTLDLSATTTGVTVDLSSSNPENGSVSDGTSTANFTDIETIILGAGDDTIVLADGSGSDTVSDFEGPIDNGDGTFTGQDQIDVSGMTDLSGDPVDVGDVVVTDDGAGNAVITFPNGENVTLLGIAPSDLDTEEELVAIGIPPILLNYIVEGTSAGELIDASYTGDPEGDMIDNNDALDGSDDDYIVAGDGDDTIWSYDGDDSIEAGDGNDRIIAGLGDDTIIGGAGNDVIFSENGADVVYAGDGDDTVHASFGADEIHGGAGDDLLIGGGYSATGHDTIYGDAGNDTIDGGLGNDVIDGGDGDDVIIASPDNDTVVGGEGDETIGDTLDASAQTTGRTVVFGANAEAGTLSDGTDTTTFSEIENIVLGSGDDTIGGATGSTNVDGGAGDDTFAVSSGADTLSGGDDADTFQGITVGDVIDGGEGGVDNDTLDLTNAAPAGGYITVDYSSPESGTVEFFDVSGASQGTASFDNIENLIGAPDINVTIHDAIELSDGMPSGGTTLYTSSGDMVEVDEPLVFTVSSAGELSVGDTVDIDGITYTISALDEVAGDVTHSDGSGGSTVTSVSAVSITLDDGAGGSLNYLVPADSFGDVEDITEFVVDTTQTWPFTGGSVAEAVVDTDDTVTLADTYSVTMYDMIETGGAVTVGTPMFTADGDLVEVDEPIVFTVLTDGQIGIGDSVDVDGVTYVITNVASYTADVTNFGGTVSATMQGLTMTSASGDTLNYLIPADGDGDIEDITQLTLVSQDSIAPWATVTGDTDDVVTLAVCFVAGTRIKTVSGEIAIEDLRIGQLVQTMDNGLQPVRWIGSTTRRAVGDLAPIRIRKGTLGNTRDLWVSPQHRMMLAGWQAEVLFGEREVLATAKSLINDDSIVSVQGGDVEYFHVLFDAHEIIYAEGAASESFHPGEQSLGALEDGSRDEILELFPELACGDYASYGSSARKSLKSFEARFLTGYGFFA